MTGSIFPFPRSYPDTCWASAKWASTHGKEASAGAMAGTSLGKEMWTVQLLELSSRGWSRLFYFVLTCLCQLVFKVGC